MKKLQVVTWLWNDTTGQRNPEKIQYTSRHVNIMKNMVKRNLNMPYDFVCITDIPEGLDNDIRVIPLWEIYRGLGGCYVRVPIFANEMKELIGDRFVSIDLDAVIVNDITPLFIKEKDFIIWGEYYRITPYCGSLLMMNAGAREQVYLNFRKNRYLPSTKKRRNYYGTDQYHITKTLYPYEAMWTSKDGIYNFNQHIRDWDRNKKVILYNTEFRSSKYTKLVRKHLGKDYRYSLFSKKPAKGDGSLPENARIVFFNGKQDPSILCKNDKYPWIKKHWN